MAAGLAALLDDVAALAKAAAASIDDVGAAAGRASVKATGVVVDDTAVTPRYVEGIEPQRELPIIKKIAIGSLRNKLILILPAIMVMSQFLPWLLMPLLMVGGAYLSFEGAEKLWEALRGGDHGSPEEKAQEARTEGAITSGAIRTDFILSSEIMVISLKEVSAEPFLSRLVILILVALLITALVYGVVALIVKMDDIGLQLTRKESTERLGDLLVRAMPKVLSVLSTVGIAAMLWVGGHIILMGLGELGWHAPYELVHHLEHTVHDAAGAAGGILGWLTATCGSALVGVIVGAIVLVVVLPLHHRKAARETARRDAGTAAETAAAD